MLTIFESTPRALYPKAHQCAARRASTARYVALQAELSCRDRDGGQEAVPIEIPTLVPCVSRSLIGVRSFCALDHIRSSAYLRAPNLMQVRE